MVTDAPLTNNGDDEKARQEADARVDRWKIDGDQDIDTSSRGDEGVDLPEWRQAELDHPIIEGDTYWEGIRMLLHPEDPNTPFDERVENLEDYVNGLTDLANDGKSDISHLRRGLQGQEGSHTDGLPTTETKLDQLKEAYYTEGRITDPTVQKQAEKVIEFWQDKKALSEGLKSGKIFQDTIERLSERIDENMHHDMDFFLGDSFPNKGRDMSKEDLEKVLADENADLYTKDDAKNILKLRESIKRKQDVIAMIADYCKDNYPDLDLSDYVSNQDSGTNPKDEPKDTPADEPKDEPKNIESQNTPKDTPADEPKDEPRDAEPGDTPHDEPKNLDPETEKQATLEKIEEIYAKTVELQTLIEAQIKELKALLGVEDDDQDSGQDDSHDDDSDDGHDDGQDNSHDDDDDDQDGGEDDGHDDDDEGQDDDDDSQNTEPNPKLVAVNVNLSAEIRSEAKRLADESLNAEIAQKGLLTRIFKGGLLNRYYKEQYRQEFLSGKRTVPNGQGVQMTLAEYITSSRGAAQAARIAAGTVDAVHFLHEGEQEHLHENAEETQLVKDAIQAYVEAVNNGTNRATALNAFREKVYANRIEAHRNGEPIDDQKYQNYETVAEQALELAEHHGGIESVLEGFKVYDAEASYAVNTKEHNTRVDRAVEWLEKRGLMVPARIVAASTGIVSSMVTSGSKALFGVGVGVGAGTILAGMKAYSKTTQDRASAFYNNAVGREYVDSSTPPTEVHGIRNRLNARQANKRANYERSIMDTNYDIVRANDLADQLKKARESGNREALLGLITDTRARQAMSEHYSVDFIGYSSSERVGDEDLNLRIELLQADQALAKMPADGNHQPGADELRVAQDVLAKELSDATTNRVAALTENMQAQDERFSGFRRSVALKAGGKYLLGTAAAMFVTSEVMGWASDRHRSVLGTVTGADANDRPDAEQSFLHKFIYGDQQFIAEQHIVDPNSNPNEINRLRQEGGWQETQGPDKTIERTVDRTTSMNTSPYRTGAKDVWLDNDTPEYDFNEQKLIGDGKHGLTIAARGVSSHGGIRYDIGNELSQGNVAGTITDQYGNKLLTPAISDGAGGWRLGDENGIYQIMDPTTGKIVGQTDLSNATAYVSGVVLKRNASGIIEEVNHFATQPIHGDLDIPTINASETVFDTVPGDITFTKWATADTNFGIPIPPIQSYNNLGVTRPITQTTSPTGGGEEPGGQEPGQPGGGEEPGQEGQPGQDEQPGQTGQEPGTQEPTEQGPGQTGTQEPTPSEPEPGTQEPTGQEGTPQPGTPIIDAEDQQNIDNLADTVRSNSNLLGNDGVDLILNTAANPDDAANQDPEQPFNSWFARLSDDGKNMVRSIAQTIMSSGPAVARSVSEPFYNWCRHYHVGQDSEAVPSNA